jgi:predicted transcriptional regulator
MHHRFTQYLNQLGLTYPVLAEATSIPERTLYRWGAGESLPSIDEVVKIARAIRRPLREVTEALDVSCVGIPCDRISEENIEAILDLLNQRMKQQSRWLVREINS